MKNTRAELHLNTAISSVEECFKAAKNHGFTAIAVTEYGKVHTFPEAYRCAKKYDVKLIYGMEGAMLLELNSDTWYTVTILVKNHLGLKALYDIVTASYVDFYAAGSKIPKDFLTENFLFENGNLLIGSGGVKGEVYSAIEAGACEEELKKIADFYDFIELHPHGDKKINKKIMEFANRYNKIVVATSDARYVYPEEQIKDMIIANATRTKKFDELPLYHMRTTDEMLRKFNYFGKEIARKIVIENSNLIADMADGTFPPIPTEKSRLSMR